MRRWIGKALLPSVAATMLVFGIYHIVHSQQKFAVPVLPPPATPARNPFGSSVAASGLVEPRSENIALGAALSGVVLEVYVGPDQVGRPIRQGEPLFRIDDRQWKAELALHEADLAAAEAQLAKLGAMPRAEEIPPSTAKVNVQEANLALMLDQYERGRRLHATKAIGTEEHVGRELRYRSAEQQLAQAKAEHELLLAGAWDADLKIAAAAVAQARAQCERTRTEIERATVRSPIDGHVLQVAVRPGEYVGSSSERVVYVVGDLSKLHVRASIDEHDIPNFTPAGRARAYLRGETRRELPLKFVRVEPYVVPKRSLTGDNNERVDTRVLQVIYEIDSSATDLFVGQQVDLFVERAEPSAAENSP